MAGCGFMRYSISDTAEYGDYTRGPRVVTEETRAEMQRILEAIQDGSFAREWLEENRRGRPNFERARQADKDHEIERVGAKLRAMMPWSEEGKRVSGAAGQVDSGAADAAGSKSRPEHVRKRIGRPAAPPPAAPLRCELSSRRCGMLT